MGGCCLGGPAVREGGCVFLAQRMRPTPTALAFECAMIIRLASKHLGRVRLPGSASRAKSLPRAALGRGVIPTSPNAYARHTGRICPWAQAARDRHSRICSPPAAGRRVATALAGLWRRPRRLRWSGASTFAPITMRLRQNI